MAFAIVASVSLVERFMMRESRPYTFNYTVVLALRLRKIVVNLSQGNQTALCHHELLNEGVPHVI